jgi:hypothetical protein
MKYWENTRVPLFSTDECHELCRLIDRNLHLYSEEGEEDVQQGDGVYERIRKSDAILSTKVKERLEDVSVKSDILPDHYDVNHLWFLTRYPTGGYIKPHFDGTTTSEDGTSVLTLLVYLNDDFTGGRTLFLDDYLGDTCDDHKITDAVVPRKGHGLLLRQDVLHVTEPVIGTKYMLRTDIMVR